MTGDVEIAGATADAAARLWMFSLYVAGDTPRSRLALSNLKQLCDDKLSGRYAIEVIDLVQHPALAASEQVLAVPTVVRRSPGPTRRVVGDLSNLQRVIQGLHIQPLEAL